MASTAAGQATLDAARLSSAAGRAAEAAWRLALAALTDQTMKRELSDFVTPEAKKCRTIHRFPTDTGDASLPAEK